MAFKLLTSGRPELISQALGLLPAAKVNSLNDQGFTALMLACLNGDEVAVLALIDAGADPNVETPAPTANQSPNSGYSNPRSLVSPSAATGPAKSAHLGASSASLTGPAAQNNNYQSQSSPVVTNQAPTNDNPNNPNEIDLAGLLRGDPTLDGPDLHRPHRPLQHRQDTAGAGRDRRGRRQTQRGQVHDNSPAGGDGLREQRNGGAAPGPRRPALPLHPGQGHVLLLRLGAARLLQVRCLEMPCRVVWCGVAWRGAVWRGAVWRGVAGLGLILIGDRRSAISVATAHGQRSCLHQLLSHPLNFSARRGEKEVLSLEEILAEGNSGTSQLSGTDGRGNPRDGSEPVFSKAQSKALQEAMYHSVESNHLGMI
jgi:hypothetical protein